MDANEERHEYDLFSLLDVHGHQTRGWTGPVYNFTIGLLEGKKLQAEYAIITAFIVSRIMTEILRQDTLQESSIVQFQAEKLYQGASAWLNRLKTVNPDTYESVKSKFPGHMCTKKLRAFFLMDFPPILTPFSHTPLLFFSKRHGDATYSP